jgi:hypothetical protein
MDSIREKTSYITDSLKSNSFQADINNINSARNIVPLTGEQNNYSLFLNIPWYFWLIIILILAFFGFNIFLYLAKGTDYISNFFGLLIEKISSFFGMAAVNTVKQIATIDAIAANEIVTNTDVVQGQNVQSTLPLNDLSIKTTLYNTLNTSQEQEEKHSEKTEYIADDSHSTIQQTKSANKTGWCYIGEDRGFRSCIKVNESDKCMSGNIFPSQDLCINPNLRV